MTEREIIMVDFDGTLTLGGRFWTKDEILPNLKVIDWVNKKYKEGNVIIIFTARPYEVMRETVSWLIKYGVKYHGINMDKPGAQIYLDDKSLNLKDINNAIKIIEMKEEYIKHNEVIDQVTDNLGIRMVKNNAWKKQEEEFNLNKELEEEQERLVKEFIRLLKERVSQSSITNDETNKILEEIDKLSGELKEEKA